MLKQAFRKYNLIPLQGSAPEKWKCAIVQNNIRIQAHLIFLELVHILHLEPPESIISGCTGWSFNFLGFFYRAEHQQIWRMEDKCSHMSADGNRTDRCEEKQSWPVCGCTVYRSLHFISEVLYLTVYVSVVVSSPCSLSVCLVQILNSSSNSIPSCICMTRLVSFHLAWSISVFLSCCCQFLSSFFPLTLIWIFPLLQFCLDKDLSVFPLSCGQKASTDATASTLTRLAKAGLRVYR